MQDHQHTISEVFTLQDKLNGKADKGHTHTKFADKDHKHDDLTAAINGKAAKQHTHEDLASANHVHNNYASKNHTHAEMDLVNQYMDHACIAVVEPGTSLNIDEYKEGCTYHFLCQNTGKAIMLQDYIVTKRRKLYNCGSILIAPDKLFAVRVTNLGGNISAIQFDGIFHD